MAKVFVIIVAHRNLGEVERCVGSLVGQRPQPRVVVVENGSERKGKPGVLGELGDLRDLGGLGEEQVTFIRNFENLGFAGGCNAGIKDALEKDAKAVLLLNQDAIAEPGLISALLKNKADIVSPIVKFKRDNSLIYDCGGKIDFILGKTYHIESGSLRILPNLDYVSGCCMLIKREVFEKIGLFDEKFFLYFEDADFCLRAKKAGFKIGVEPKAFIFHYLKEGKKKPWFQYWSLLKSKWIFINRYVGPKYRVAAYAGWVVLFLKILAGRII